MDTRREAGKDKKQLQMLIKGLDGAQARVGWFETAKYENGTPVAGIAMVQEFGSPAARIPPRSFIRTTIAQKRNAWRQGVGIASARSLRGQSDPLEIMEALAMTAAGDFRKKITEIWAPPLKPETVMRRIRRLSAYRDLKTRSGKIRHMKRRLRRRRDFTIPLSINKPLVDTGMMLDSLTYDVARR